MNERSPESTRLVGQITSVQQRLYAYIFSLVGDADRAQDVLQETNLVLWNKSAEFEPGTNFVAWAYRIAHFQVLAYRKRNARDRLVFDDGVVAALADETAARLESFDVRRAAMQRCMERLTEHQRRIVTERYMNGTRIVAIAKSMQMTTNAVGQALHRARLALAECIRRTVESDGAGEERS